MTYKIKVRYETGDSFGHHTEETTLEMSWKNEDKAKAALKRIEEHWKWYAANHKYWFGKDKDKPKEPKWHKVMPADDYGKNDEIIELVLDNGKKVKFWPPWCGYFETLYIVEIVVDTYKIEF